jgi:hypothetical protein
MEKKTQTKYSNNYRIRIVNAKENLKNYYKMLKFLSYFVIEVDFDRGPFSMFFFSLLEFSKHATTFYI